MLGQVLRSVTDTTDGAAGAEGADDVGDELGGALAELGGAVSAEAVDVDGAGCWISLGSWATHIPNMLQRPM